MPGDITITVEVDLSETNAEINRLIDTMPDVMDDELARLVREIIARTAKVKRGR